MFATNIAEYNCCQIIHDTDWTIYLFSLFPRWLSNSLNYNWIVFFLSVPLKPHKIFGNCCTDAGIKQHQKAPTAFVLVVSLCPKSYFKIFKKFITRLLRLTAPPLFWPLCYHHSHCSHRGWEPLYTATPTVQQMSLFLSIFASCCKCSFWFNTFICYYPDRICALLQMGMPKCKWALPILAQKD